MQNTFSFGEITDGQRFQHLVADYFELGLGHTTERGGIGPDAGKDLLVTSVLNDPVVPFQRKWVVQCKCYEETVRLRDIASVNIPTLVHNNQANGYLLVCKKEVHNQIRELFNELNDGNCKMGYKYEIWDGNQFHSKMLMLKSGLFFRKHFPDYHEFLVEKETRENDIKIQEMINVFLEKQTGGVK